MLLLKKPNLACVQKFHSLQAGRPFSYRETGATRGPAPAGYFADRRRTLLGHGWQTFLLARQALSHWEMFRVGWAELYPAEAPQTPETTVAFMAGRCGLWTLNACRIVYAVDETGPVTRSGFAYGTLPDHVARGEELFLVEHCQADDSVWYHLASFSWPNYLITQCGLPLMRLAQQRFARDSARAMQRAVQFSLSDQRSQIGHSNREDVVGHSDAPAGQARVGSGV